MRFTVAVPDVRSAMKGIEADLAATITAGMRDVTDGLKNDLRASVTGAGLGQRVANAWRGKTYPQGTDSLEPAAYVYSNAAKIVESFNDGAIIRSSKGKFLSIPTEFAGKGPNGQHLTPLAYEAKTGNKLQFVAGKRGNARLIATLRLRGGAETRAAARQFGKPTAASLRTGKGLTSVVIFYLVRSANLRKRFDIKSTADDWASRVPGAIDARWKA